MAFQKSANTVGGSGEVIDRCVNRTPVIPRSKSDRHVVPELLGADHFDMNLVAASNQAMSPGIWPLST